MSSLSQRMGELRDSSAEHGVWARVYGGKVENGSKYDNEYQTYQAVSYTHLDVYKRQL